MNCQNALEKCGFKGGPDWERLCYHPTKGLFLSVYVDDFKMAGPEYIGQFNSTEFKWIQLNSIELNWIQLNSIESCTTLYGFLPSKVSTKEAADRRLLNKTYLKSLLRDS